MFSFNIEDRVEYIESYKKTVILALCYMIVFIIIGLILIKTDKLLFIIGIIAGTISGLAKLLLTYKGIDGILSLKRGDYQKIVYSIMNAFGYIFIVAVLVISALKNKYLLIGTMIGIFFVYFSMILIVLFDAIAGEKAL